MRNGQLAVAGAVCLAALIVVLITAQLLDSHTAQNANQRIGADEPSETANSLTGENRAPPHVNSAASSTCVCDNAQSRPLQGQTNPVVAQTGASVVYGTVRWSDGSGAPSGVVKLVFETRSSASSTRVSSALLRDGTYELQLPATAWRVTEFYVESPECVTTYQIPDLQAALVLPDGPSSEPFRTRLDISVERDAGELLIVTLEDLDGKPVAAVSAKADYRTVVRQFATDGTRRSTSLARTALGHAQPDGSIQLKLPSNVSFELTVVPRSGRSINVQSDRLSDVFDVTHAGRVVHLHGVAREALKGVVSDDTGKRLIFTSFVVANSAGWDEWVRSDSSGTFTTQHLAPTDAVYAYDEFGNQAGPFTPTEDAFVAIELPRPARLELEITNVPTSTPAMWYVNSHSLRRDTTTREVFQSIAPIGIEDLWVVVEGYAPHGPFAVDLRPGETAAHRFQLLWLGGRVTGVLQSERGVAARIPLTIREASGAVPHNVLPSIATDDDGRFSVNHLRAGTYIIAAHHTVLGRWSVQVEVWEDAQVDVGVLHAEP